MLKPNHAKRQPRTIISVIRYSSTKSNQMSRVLTLLIIGMAVGVLIAPEKGSVTRCSLPGF